MIVLTNQCEKIRNLSSELTVVLPVDDSLGLIRRSYLVSIQHLKTECFGTFVLDSKFLSRLVIWTRLRELSPLWKTLNQLKQS